MYSEKTHLEVLTLKKSNFNKIYVLDTNVLLHDPQAIFKFEDNLVVIPIVVLEELDNFKKGQNENGKNSRQVSRYLDKLREISSLSEGVELDNGGYLKIDMTSKEDKTADNAIIDTALSLKVENKDKKVAVVSKDINLRIKADALGVSSEDYESDKVNFQEMYTGVKVHECDGTLIDKLYSDKSIPIEEIENLGTVFPNQYIVLKNIYAKQKGICRFDKKSNSLVTLRGNGKTNIWGVSPKNLEQTMAMDLLLNDDIKLVSLVGKAGTGKTLLAVASGLKKAIDEQTYKKMLVARPIIPMGRDLGYLPGDLNEKMDPWLKPIFDNMEYLFGCNKEGANTESYKILIEQGFVAVEPLTYIRGRSLPNQYIIIDESQNLTSHEIKTILTRAGEGTKIVLTGDCYQIDNPYVDSSSNGLSKVVNAFRDEEIAGHITLLKGERSELADIASNVL
jgi:PhoH-like ATPase